MTPEHVFYIPIIFILGFLVGALVNEPRIASVPSESRRTSGKRLLITFLLFLGVFIVTHFFDIPYSSRSVSEALGGVPIFDKKPCFTSQEVYHRLGLCHQEGLDSYQRFTYTVDVLFPASLLWLLLTLVQFVGQRRSLSIPVRRILKWLPVSWFAMDMLENMFIFIILNQYPSEVGVAGILGYVTLVKFGLLVLSVVGPALVLLRRGNLAD